jgi:hypothetical protein
MTGVAAPVTAIRDDVKTSSRLDVISNRVEPVATPFAAFALRAAHDDRVERRGDNWSRPLPATGHRKKAESWDDWMQVPMDETRGKHRVRTPDWSMSWDGKNLTTPARPTGAAYAFEEGPYYRTKELFEAFRLTIQYRTLDQQPVTPRPPPFPHTNQDFSDSGIYIYNRYEVLIIDPSKFDGPDDPDGGVPTGGEVVDDPRIRRDGRVVPNNRNMLVPGSVYGVDIPSGVYVNWANPTEQWNTLVIEFEPPELDLEAPNVIAKAARIRTILNGHVVFDGEINGLDGMPLNGTGVMRSNQEPVSQGFIYLQSHWGSQIEFRDPNAVEVGSAAPPANSRRSGLRPGWRVRPHRPRRSGGNPGRHSGKSAARGRSQAGGVSWRGSRGHAQDY